MEDRQKAKNSFPADQTHAIFMIIRFFEYFVSVGVEEQNIYNENSSSFLSYSTPLCVNKGSDQNCISRRLVFGAIKKYYIVGTEYWNNNYPIDL